jgi:5-methylthioadenosine/S-adenosylhomocysteine deaminase
MTMSKSSPILIRGAAAVTMDPALGDLLATDILIEEGVIREIAPSIDENAVRSRGGVVIEAGAMIAVPGFVDSHRHLWEGLIRNVAPDLDLGGYFATVMGKYGPAYEAKDVYAGTLVSALGALNAGVTTVLDWAHNQTTPEHTDASIEALREAGIRAVFAYGAPTRQDQGHAYPQDILRLARDEFASRDQLLTLALATGSPENLPLEVARRNWGFAREAGARLTVHAGLPHRANPGAIEAFGNEGLLRADLTLVHCAFLSPVEWRMLADNGVTVSVSPQVEAQMGHGSAPIQAALDAGLLPSLSVDVETSAPGDFFTQMRAALAEQRGESFRRKFRGEAQPDLIGARDVLRMATIGGAQANGLADRTGSLTVGKQADIVLLRADRINVLPVNDLVGAVVAGMDVSNVDTVIVGGEIRKRHGELVDVDYDRVFACVYEARDRVFKSAGIDCPCPRHFGGR